MIKNTWILGIVLTVSNASQFSYNVGVNVATQYIEQGGQTQNSTFYSTGVEVGYKTFTFAAEQGHAPDTDFEEVALSLHYSTDLTSDVSLEVGYVRLDYAQDNSFGNELEAIFSYSGFSDIGLFLAGYYNHEAEGFYSEAGADYSVELSEGLALNFYGLVGADFGFTTPEFDGSNVIEMGAELVKALAPHTEAYASLHQTYRLQDLKKAGEKDHTWMNFGVGYSF